MNGTAQEKKYNKLMTNTAIIAMGTLGSKVLVYLLVRLYTSVLTAVEYSIASNITEMAALLIPIVSFGISEAVFRFALDKKYDERSVLSSGIAAFLLGAFFFPVIILILSGINYFDGYIWLICIYTASSIIHSIFAQFIKAKARFKLFAVQGIINTLIMITCNVIFLIPLNMGVTGYVLSVAVADTLTSVFIFFFCKLWRMISPYAVKKQLLGRMLLYSLPLIPNTMSWWITNVSDRYMITWMKGDVVNGFYSAAYKIPTLLMVLIGIFNSAWKYSAVSERSEEEGARFFSNVYEAFLSAMFGVSAVIIAFSKIISGIMFASDFRDAWIYIPVLTLAMAFSALSSFTGTVFIIEKKGTYSLLTSLIAAILNIALNLLLIPLFDDPLLAAMGAATATLASYFVMFISRLALSRQLIRYKAHALCTFLNILTVSVMALTMTLEVPFYPVYQAAGLAAMLFINRKTVIKALRKLIYEHKS